MKPLLLLIIGLALTPTSYAFEEIEIDRDRDKFLYGCKGDNLWFCKKYLKKGDQLELIEASGVVKYCDKEELIIASEKTLIP